MIKSKCSVCGSDIILDECVVCDTCGWEDDILQENDPDYRGGANKESLNEYRAEWQRRNDAQ